MKNLTKEMVQKTLLALIGEGAEIGISVYDERNRNFRLSVTVNGEVRPDLTINPNKRLADGYLFLNVADYPWIKDFFRDTLLGYDKNASYPKDGFEYPLFQTYLFKFKELDPEGYQAYMDLFNRKHEVKRWTNRDKTDKKGKYKTKDSERREFNSYHSKTDGLVAYLPLGTRDRITATSETPTVFFKKAVNDYLDHLERG